MPAVLYEKHDHIATITLNRPEAMNACNREMWQRLEQCWWDIIDDPAVWVVILTGAGDRAFCVGADLKEMAQAPPPMAPSRRPKLLDDWELPVWKPVIAAVNGYAMGSGLSMVMACDLRIAAEHAQFAMSQVRWGIASGTGTQILTRQLPYAVAMEVLLTGQPISAQRAFQVGLVNRVVPREQLMPAALEMAALLRENAPLALQHAKEAAVQGLHFTLPDAIRYGLLMEMKNFQTEDAREGPRAFAERRKPQWKAR